VDRRTRIARLLVLAGVVLLVVAAGPTVLQM